jgi:glycine/serine hydroxymethyltransferase
MANETWYVDIPTLESANDEEAPWIPVATFSTYAEAIEYTQKHFGADENGCILLITGG